MRQAKTVSSPFQDWSLPTFDIRGTSEKRLEPPALLHTLYPLVVILLDHVRRSLIFRDRYLPGSKVGAGWLFHSESNADRRWAPFARRSTPAEQSKPSLFLSPWRPWR